MRRLNGKPQQLSKKETPASRRHAIAALSFFFLLTAVGVLSVVLTKPSFSALENRRLEAFPRFSLSALFFGHYPDHVASWYADTFPAREKLVGGASFLRRIRGVNSASIHLGLGSLQDFDDDPEPLDEPGEGTTRPAPAPADTTRAAVSQSAEVEKVTAPPAPDEKGEVRAGLVVLGDTALELYGFSAKDMTRYANLVNRFAETYGIDTSVLVTPTNIEFKLPARYKSMTSDQKKALEFLDGKLDAKINNVRVYDTMAQHSGEYIFFRTDHHWTGLGAYYAYLELCESRGFRAAPLESYETWEHAPFLGSFYRSLGGDAKMKANPDTLTVYRVGAPYEMYCYTRGLENKPVRDYLSQPPESLRFTEEKYIAFSAGDPPYARIVTENNTGRRLLLIRESFAAAMTPFLTENYDEIHVVDFRYYKGDIHQLIRGADITEALFLNYISAAGSPVQMNRMERMFGWE
ncbi:MAG: DHHW family protein [Oscillospiraceae bacterium]|nr:DHHW family protein [Oscillospiraceae bacterium]